MATKQNEIVIVLDNEIDYDKESARTWTGKDITEVKEYICDYPKCLNRAKKYTIVDKEQEEIVEVICLCANHYNEMVESNDYGDD